MTGTEQPKGPSRRALLGALGVAVGAGAAGAAGALTATGSWPGEAQKPDAGGTPAGSSGQPVLASGRYQAGIARPATPQHFGLLLVCDLDGTDTSWLGALGNRILELTTNSKPTDVLPDGPGDLTVTVGLGPRIVAARDASLPGAEDLPSFAGDETIEAHRRGGDLLLALYSDDPSVLTAVGDDLLTLVPGATPRWRQRLFRGHGENGVVRNPFGFLDGVIVPHGDEELAENVWIGTGTADAALASGTVCVIRRLRLDTARFAALGTPAQERVIGRERIDGTPLSGGPENGEVDLNAKTPEGEFVTPLRSHARAAHPSFTGSSLMLRRGYAFDDGLLPNGEADAGLAFICFQNTLRTFVVTQQRLDENDDLMKYATPTGSATFLILPGFSASSPLTF